MRAARHHVTARLLLIALLALLAGAPPLGAEEIVETADDGTVRLRYEVDEQGRKHGVFVRYHPDGTPALKATYKEDKRDGLERAWDEHGVLRHAHTYKRGSLHGSHKTYDAKGHLQVHQHYRGGVLHGSYKSYHPNRRLHVVTAYRAGKRHGPYTERTPQGLVRIKTSFDAGRKHGTYEVFEGKRRRTKQRWVRGVPLDVDGVAPFPRTRKALGEALTRLQKGTGALPSDLLEADRVLALRELKAYRCLAGVPYADLELDSGMNALAQAGAEICAALRRITHEPPNPGWPQARYEPAARGAKGSNLHQRQRACTSVRGYMDDSDPRNIRTVGHRNWCLHPPMRKTGFGYENGFTAMWAMDESRSPVPDYQMIGMPPPGYVPSAWIGARWAWSTALNPKHFDAPSTDRVKAHIHVVGHDFLPTTPEPLTLDAHYVNDSTIAVPYLIVFRPKAISLAAGARYRVTLEGLTHKGKPKLVRYFVEFFEHPYVRPKLPRRR